MKWLISLETDSDPIAACRLMNIFRRKGLKIGTLTLTAQPEGFFLRALVESPEADVEHIYNFLRGTAGVHHVDYYRHEPSADASFLFIDAAADTTSVAGILEAFPGAKLLFGGHGKYLLEVSAGIGRARENFAEAGCLSFARVRTSRGVPQAVAALAS
jgi:hypothetical protein